ncbi:hypothetical protein BRAS3843_1260029 [Bradyrhizobium sp. STM 3843]|nr:hypothetical protein BRAS3843_1260029 [Bradyrhizobium sp. STM 3843]
MDAPRAGALHQLGEASRRLQQGDNLSERINGHGRRVMAGLTLKKQGRSIIVSLERDL